MADEEKEETQEAPAEAGKEKATGGKKSLLPWIILAIVVPVFAGMGFGLGRLVAGPKVEQVEEEPEDEKIELPAYMTLMNEKGDAAKTWFYDKIEPVVANLNDPGASRYIRVSFAFEINGKMPQGETSAYLDQKAFVMKDLVGKYLATQSLKDLQGDRNLNRVPMEIRDMLNQAIFPDMEPVIVNVLYRDRAIQ